MWRFLVFVIAQTVAGGLRKALDDGKITLGEVVDIAKDVVDNTGLSELQIYPWPKSTKKGKKNAKRG